MASTQVVVIGGGWSGLLALKHCLGRKLSAVALEAREDLGGVWNFSEDPERITVQDCVIEGGEMGCAITSGRDIILRRRLKEEPDTLEDLSQDYNISRERVRQIESEGGGAGFDDVAAAAASNTPEQAFNCSFMAVPFTWSGGRLRRSVAPDPCYQW